MNIVDVFECYPTQDACLDYIKHVRWGGKPVCPYCGSTQSSSYKSEQRHHCNTCNTSFSVTVGTIFHKTRLPLQKWFLALMLILNTKKDIAARQLARDLKVNKDTAWRISIKIREAMMERDQRELLTGIVEMDEQYVGGKPRKGGPAGQNKRGRGTNKTPVVGIIERGGKVKAQVIKNRKLDSKSLSALARKNIKISNAMLIEDEY